MTILSYGGGQDSTALLLKCLFDESFKRKYIIGDFIVVMAGTGNEHPETDKYVQMVETLCYKKGVLFHHIGTKDGHHTGDWKGGLVGFYEAGNRIGSKSFPKTCTDKLKIQPIYKWVDHYLYHTCGHGKYNKKMQLAKTPIYDYVKVNEGKINVILGIAKGEERRVAKNEDSPSKWMRECINKIYPLIDLGMDRERCQRYINSMGFEVPIPSNCILCPFMDQKELLLLFRTRPFWYNKWVELEANKIKANLNVEKNNGVWGEKLLPEVLKEAIEKHGHMTTDQLKEYRFSHGHCVASKY